MENSPHTAVTSLAVVLPSDATVRAQEKPSLRASPGFNPLPGRTAGRGRSFGYPQGQRGPAVDGRSDHSPRERGLMQNKKRERAEEESRSER